MAATSTATNAGFAFVVNSLLSSNKNAKVLSKAKKESDIRAEPSETPLEVISEDGKVVPVTSAADSTTTAKKPKNAKLSKITKHQLESIGRTKPKLEDRERERRLAAVATKGVVQLFNVVKEQQKNIKHKLDEVGTSTSKRAKVLEQFNEESLFEKANKKDAGSERTSKKESGPEKKKWKVLSDDFMTGAKFKDWDKESDDSD